MSKGILACASSSPASSSAGKAESFFFGDHPFVFWALFLGLPPMLCGVNPRPLDLTVVASTVSFCLLVPVREDAPCWGVPAPSPDILNSADMYR